MFNLLMDFFNCSSRGEAMLRLDIPPPQIYNFFYYTCRDVYFVFMSKCSCKKAVNCAVIQISVFRRGGVSLVKLSFRVYVLMLPRGNLCQRGFKPRLIHEACVQDISVDKECLLPIGFSTPALHACGCMGFPHACLLCKSSNAAACDSFSA